MVRTPDGRLVLDESGRLPGRGAYLCADGSCWQIALDKHTLQRALEAPLPDEVQALMKERAGSSLREDPQGEVIGQE